MMHHGESPVGSPATEKAERLKDGSVWMQKNGDFDA